MGAFSGDLEIGKVFMQISEIVCGGGFRSFIGFAEDELSGLVAVENRECRNTDCNKPFTNCRGPGCSWRTLWKDLSESLTQIDRVNMQLLPICGGRYSFHQWYP